MNSFEVMIARFYDNRIVLSKDERSVIERQMIAFAAEHRNLRNAFELLKFMPQRSPEVYSYAADCIFKILRKNLQDVDDGLKSKLKDELFGAFLQLSQMPNSQTACNRLLMCLATLTIRSTDVFPNFVTEIFRMIFSKTPNVEWLFKYLIYVAEEFGDVKENRAKIAEVLSNSNNNVIQFISSSLPEIPVKDSENTLLAIKCLETWTIKFEVTDNKHIDLIVDTLLKAMTNGHQSSFAEPALCKIFEQPIYEKSLNLIRVVFHEMFGYLNPVISAKFKERDNEHIKNIFLLFLKMGITHFGSLYLLEEPILETIAKSYFEIVHCCTPVCLKSVDSNLIFDFWTEVFTQQKSKKIDALVKSSCRRTFKELSIYSKYTPSCTQWNDEDREAFHKYRQALSESLPAFYQQIGDEIFVMLKEALFQAMASFNRNDPDWIFTLELCIFLYTRVEGNIKEKNHEEIVAVFDAITSIPFEKLSFIYIHYSILQFFKQYSPHFNDNATKNQKMFNLIAGMVKTGDRKLAAKSIWALEHLTDNGFDTVRPFFPDIARLFIEVFNRSSYLLPLKIDFAGAFCRIINDSTTDVGSNAIQSVILPFIGSLKNNISPTNPSPLSVVELLTLITKIFEKLDNPNFTIYLFDLYAHIDLEFILGVLPTETEVLKAICLCVHAYLHNVGQHGEEHMGKIGEILIKIYRYFIPQVWKTLRFFLCLFKYHTVFNRAFEEILCRTIEKFNANFNAADPDLIQVFFEEMANIVRKTNCQLSPQIWSSLLALSAQAIQLNESEAGRSATFFIRTLLNAAEGNPAIKSVFQTHFIELVDVLIRILINAQTLPDSIDSIADIFFLFKKIFASNFIIAIKSSQALMIDDTKKNNFVRMCTTCNNKQIMKQLILQLVPTS